MLKWKFGGAVRPKTAVAIRNKVLGHNVVVVIHEMHELGFDPAGFGSQPKAEPRILQFSPNLRG